MFELHARRSFRWLMAMGLASAVAPAQTQCVILDEQFSGTALSSAWEGNANGGTVSVANGLLSLTKGGATFPFVRTVPGSLNIGTPWTLEVSMRWNSERYCGNGLHFGPDVVVNLGNPCRRGLLVPPVSVWRDSTGTSGVQVKAGPQLRNLGVVGTPFVTLKWEGDGCDIVVSRNGHQLFSGSYTGDVPDNLWFGNPCTGCAHANWANMDVDWVRITSACPPAVGDRFFDQFAYVFSGTGCTPPATGTPRTRCGSTPGGLWHKVSWDAGHTFFDPALVTTSQQLGEPGLDDLILDVPGTPSGQTPSGARVESAAVYGRGSYRARLQPPLPTATVAGTVTAFALSGRDRIDVQILTANPAANGCGGTTVCCSLRNMDACGNLLEALTVNVPVPYAPGQDYRVVGWDWLDNRIDFHVDGVAVTAIRDGDLGSGGQPMVIPRDSMRLVLEHWTGNGVSGPPPSTVQRARVDWVSYAPLSLSGDADTLSAGGGGAINYSLQAGAAFAGETWVMLGSLAGSTPGLTFPPNGPHIPLNLHPVLSQLFVPSVGTLDAAGGAVCAVTLPPGLPASVVGLDFYAGFAALGAAITASNPWRVRFVP